jgi:hypothetical protein
MRSDELRELVLQLSADVRAGRYEPDWDLGKSEYLGDSREKAAAYAARARPLLEELRRRRLITLSEVTAHSALGLDRQVAADRLQVLAELLQLE